MPYRLPNKLPDEIVVSGKTYKRVGGKASVDRGVCTSNDGSWHYYFNKTVVDAPGPLGGQRHFSVRTTGGQRAVHISMKPRSTTGPKRDDIMIWYRYESQWTGRQTEPEGWGTTSFPSKNRTRVEKGVNVLRAFLEAMTEVAEGRLPAITPCLTPPLSTFPVVSPSTDSGEWNDAVPSATTTIFSSWDDEDTTTANNTPVKDSWED